MYREEKLVVFLGTKSTFIRLIVTRGVKLLNPGGVVGTRHACSRPARHGQRGGA
jgi:hypothetical protein